MKNSMTLLILFFFIFALTGCGSGTAVPGFNGDGKDSLSSLGDDPVGQPTQPTVTTGAKSLCNKIEGAGFRGRTQIFKYKGAFYANTQQVQIDQLPEGYADSQSLLQFFRWKTDGTPTDVVSFYLEDRATHTPVSGFIKALSATDIGAISAKAYGQTMTALAFMGRVNFVLSDVAATEWKAIRLAYFQNESLVGDTDFLVPQFAADPNEFAKQNPGFLAQLHPSFSLKGTANQNFLALAHQYCF